MQMDGVALYAAAKEIDALLSGGRIERIAQPNRADVVFTIRANGTNHRLLFSADPECARIQLGGSSDKGPDKPYTFLMMLRKHLVHGRILQITAPQMDRAVRMTVQVTDDLGDRVELCFIAECMGKHSNLILIDPNGIILDSAKRIPPAVSSLRTVLPGERYHNPPAQQKHNVLALSREQITEWIETVPDVAADKALVSLFYGISPFTAQQLCQKVLGDIAQAPLENAQSDAIASSLYALVQSLQSGTFEASLQTDDSGAPIAFAPFVIMGNNVQKAHSLCAAVLQYTEYRLSKSRILREKQALQAAVNARLEKLYKRLQFQLDVLAQSVSYESIREQGEFMLAYAHEIKRGMEHIQVHDYIHDVPVVLTLDPTLSAAENANKLFKRYQKLKSSSTAAQQQKDQVLPEIAYWESILLSIEQSETMEELQDIRTELQIQQLIRTVHSQGKSTPPQSKPLRFVSNDGVEILCGRNNIQNDLVTCRLSRSGDTWLHAQGMPGSHVLIKANPVPPETLRQAAHIAAFFSRGRHSSNVPVDYTLIKNVHKPSGSKPGFVTYTNQKTLFVTPEGDLVKSLIHEEA